MLFLAGTDPLTISSKHPGANQHVIVIHLNNFCPSSALSPSQVPCHPHAQGPLMGHGKPPLQVPLPDGVSEPLPLTTHTAPWPRSCCLRPWSPCPSSSLLSVHPGDSALSIFFISSCILHWAGLGILHLRSQETLLSITAPSLMARSRIRAMLSSSLQ